MEKVLVPSVTLIVGCGVSSLTLLLLIIIYVSVWRYGFHSLLFLLGKVICLLTYMDPGMFALWFWVSGA